jgi:Ferritin-like domain
VIRRRRTEPIPVSEAEVVAMTSDLEDAHRDSLSQLHATLSEWRETTASRRAFLIGSGAVVGGVALVARGGLTQAAAASVRGSAVPAAKKKHGQKLTGDLAVVALAASLENLAVGTYQAGIDAATAGELGTVPPAVVTFAQTAQSQHSDHAAAWNGVLTGAGKQAVTGVDATVKKSVDAAFAQVKDVPGLAMLALELENGAAATYLAAIDGVKSTDGIAVAATIQPVEMQHAAILNFLLGQYPVPDSFAKQDGARTTKDKIG